MKYLFLILMVISISLFSGCAFGDDPERLKEKTIEGMKPTVKGKYTVYAYFEKIPPNTTTTEQAKVYKSMNEKIPLEKVETLSIMDIEDSNIFNIERFPTFIVVDKTGVVLQTTDIDKLVDFIKKTNPDHTD